MIKVIEDREAGTISLLELFNEAGYEIVLHPNGKIELIEVTDGYTFSMGYYKTVQEAIKIGRSWT